MNDLILIFLTTIFVNNLILTRFLGLCPFIGTSKNSYSAVGMSIAVVFIITISSFVAHSIGYLILKPFNLEYLKTLVFILVISSFVQILEIVLKKFFHALYQVLGVFLPLVTTNCAVLGVILINFDESTSIIESTFYGFSASCGFALALILLNSVRENLHERSIPKVFQGNSIIFITVGIIALGFMGFQHMGNY